MRRKLQNRYTLFVAGLLLGVLLLLGIRFATYRVEAVHYHANFAVYINGKRELFKGPQYYQEVSICSASKGITIPQQRSHMHEQDNALIHVHDHASTWGQFFENLGWYIGPDFIETDAGTMYVAHDNIKVNVVINGQDYTDLNAITNRVIGDKDRLLVSYETSNDAVLKTEFATVPSTATHADETQDPASCSGNEKVTFKDRLHHLF
jgi:hypothetical protein